jgi:hypothetical protein
MRVTRFVVAAVVVFACCAVIFLWPRKPETTATGEPGRDAFFDAGMPYGRITDGDLDRLQVLATQNGIDLIGELDRIYRGGYEKEDSLDRVFAFASKFDRLDDNARAYGHIIWSSLLNIGEIIGVPAYVAMINRQPPEIQQRIRDFLLYPHQSPESRAAADETYPGLFPSEYRFGHGNPVFARKPQPDD